MSGRISETLRINKAFFILFELIFLGIGVWMLYSGMSTKDKGIEITATIERIDVTTERVYRDGEYRTEKDYDVYIDYEYKGQSYNDVLYSYYDSSMVKGKKITIQIDKNDPTTIYYSSQNILMGAIFSGVAVIMILVTAFAVKRSENQVGSGY